MNLKAPEVYPRLVRQIDVRQSRNTSLMEIRVYDEDAKTASDIANEIAKVYEINRLARSVSG